MRELDERVAEEILGWTAMEGAEIPDYITSPNIPSNRGHTKKVWVRLDPTKNLRWERMACLECGDFPHYSEDILTAWLLVEHIQKLYPWCRFSICGGTGMNSWSARFFGDAPNASGDRPFSWGRSYQNTAPLAIVHAALGAVPSIKAYLASSTLPSSVQRWQLGVVPSIKAYLATL